MMGRMTKIATKTMTMLMMTLRRLHLFIGEAVDPRVVNFSEAADVLLFIEISVLFDIFLLRKAPKAKEAQKMNYETKNRPFLHQPPSSEFFPLKMQIGLIGLGGNISLAASVNIHNSCVKR